MSAPAKFLFDVDFSRNGPNDAQKTVSVATHEAALAEKAASAYQQGYAAAAAEAAHDDARRLAQALERVGEALHMLAGGFAGIEARLETEAVEVAVAVARKLSAALIAQEPLTEIEALASQCFTHLVSAPHVVVRLNDRCYGPACERLEALTRERGFEGRLVVLAEPALGDGDCRIEWADGGLVRDRAAIELVIAEAVERYMLARRGIATNTGETNR